MDVDGTYTNGLIFYDTNGEVIKGFHAHDGFALELFRFARIKRGFITGRKDNATRARAEYLKADFICENIAHKDIELKKLLDQYGIDPSEAAFIGDDLNDLSAFTVAGVKIAVANATDAIKANADYITTHSGGNGAVREAAELILKAKGIDIVELWNNRDSSVIGKQ